MFVDWKKNNFHYINIPFHEKQIYFYWYSVKEFTKIQYHLFEWKKILCKNSSNCSFTLNDNTFSVNQKENDLQCVFCKDNSFCFTSYLVKVFIPEDSLLWFLLLNEKEIEQINDLFNLNNKDNLFELKECLFSIKSNYKDNYSIKFIKQRFLLKEAEKQLNTLSEKDAKNSFFRNYDIFINTLLKDIKNNNKF